MSTKRRIIKDICKADGLSKAETKEVLMNGCLVVEESGYNGLHRIHKSEPIKDPFIRPVGFHKILKHGKVIRSGEIW